MRKENRSRALRNFAITLVLAVFLWAVRGFDLPTMEMEMHRSERQHMMDESRVIWEYEGKMYNDRDIIVGLGPKYITTRAESGHGAFWPRAVEGPTLVGLPTDTRYNPPGTGHSYLAPGFLAVDAPARAVSARLAMELSYNEWSEIYVMEGEKQGPAWFFQLMMKYTPTVSEEEQEQSGFEDNAFMLTSFMRPDHFYYPCTLEFFDKDGTCISTLELNGGAELS